MTRESAKFDLIAALKNYNPSDSADQACLSRFLHFVTTYPNCFERSLSIGHVTGSAWVVDESGECVLLTRHAKLQKWLQLGGHADGDPDVLKVAGREAEEESGLKKLRLLSTKIFDLDIHEIPATRKGPVHFHYDVRFAFQSIGSEPLCISAESLELKWCRIEYLPELSSEESLLKMARKWLLLKAQIAQEARCA